MSSPGTTIADPPCTVGILRETAERERRVALDPDATVITAVKQYVAA